ncbi:MAG TPA: MBL fold metallo-hydrolase [Gammaproteobacteria bacterium]|nr:MBL fold metallo-hydrolase [Gammaproteobacteria bacterium]
MKTDVEVVEGRTRRDFLIDAARLAALSAVAAGAPFGGWGRPAAAQTVTGPAAEPDSASYAVLLGTQGGPSVNLRRGMASSVVVIGGQPYLVDCGYGAVRALVESGLGYMGIRNVFLTHLHDDHTLDLTALMSLQWTGRSTKRTDVYGPYGTAALVAAALDYLAPNFTIRTVDEGRSVRPETLFYGHDAEASATPTKVFEDERVRVTCAENTHYPEAAKARMPFRSVAYRLDAADRSFVFAGDTTYSKNLVELARNADVLVCEAMDVAQHERLVRQAKEAEEKGDPNSAFLHHVADTHSTTEQVGQMAAEAGVKTVALNHLLPGSNGPLARELPDTTYIAGVRKFFSGSVIVGRDQMRL